ncbi:lactate dehydrogenase [Vibrio sp. 10N.261.51.F12]|uniref:lactate dehydrogenase n=1 Tax=Vibrio sp. 10N.261.51.F12 TaxID=3229679 RepID=UPI003553289B
MSEGKLPRAANGLQLNFCKTLACDNFGQSDASLYILQHSNPKRPAMVCRECGAFPPLLNNQEVLSELKRLQLAHDDGLPCCKDAQCEHFGMSVYTHKERYHAFGFSGDRQRYRCKQCQGTFVDKWSGTNKKTLIQEALLALLFTGYSVREICRKLDINPKTFYDNIDQIASRCRRKLANIDARWLNHASHYELASNYQSLQKSSNNGVFWFVTCEANSGYVLCQHTNYTAQTKSSSNLDHDAYQQNSQFLPSSYQAENYSENKSFTGNDTTKEHSGFSLKERIDINYQNILARSNVEDPLGNFSTFNYPNTGTLIRAPYTSYAHYLLISEMIGDQKPLTIYMPQDPLLRSAALTVYLERIHQNNIDLMYVLQDPHWDNSGQSKTTDIALMGWWRDRWTIAHQDNGASKGLCYLSGNDSFASNADVFSHDSHNDSWLKTASIQSALFYQNRFQLLFESFINEPRRKLRPNGIMPLLDIFRAWHNLCYQDKQGLTAAQRLNICQTPMTLKQLLE